MNTLCPSPSHSNTDTHDLSDKYLPGRRPLYRRTKPKQNFKTPQNQTGFCSITHGRPPNSTGLQGWNPLHRSADRCTLTYNRTIMGHWKITCTAELFRGMLLDGIEEWQGICRSSPMTVKLISADQRVSACQSMIFPTQKIYTFIS
jgi:hypothetical protein